MTPEAAAELARIWPALAGGALALVGGALALVARALVRKTLAGLSAGIVDAQAKADQAQTRADEAMLACKLCAARGPYIPADAFKQMHAELVRGLADVADSLGELAKLERADAKDLHGRITKLQDRVAGLERLAKQITP